MNIMVARFYNCIGFRKTIQKVINTLDNVAVYDRSLDDSFLCQLVLHSIMTMNIYEAFTTSNDILLLCRLKLESLIFA